MRTTVTLDPDTRLLVERAMRERGLSFKAALNEAIRAGLGPRDSGPGSYTTPRALGPARTDLTKSLGLAARLEDDALAGRLAEGAETRVVIVDANVLLYAVDSAGAHHESSLTWLDRSLAGAEAVGLAWVALLAFVRIGTNPAILEAPMSTNDALDQVQTWLAAPAATVVHPTARHPEILRGLLADSGTAGNLTTDAHFAALAVEHGAEIVSWDRDFGRFAGLKHRIPG